MIGKARIASEFFLFPLDSRDPRGEQLAEAAQVNQTVRRESAYDRKAPHGLPSSRLVSTTRFDLWMTRAHPDLPWCRYADDGLVHCRNEQKAQALKAELQARPAECRMTSPADGKVYARRSKASNHRSQSNYSPSAHERNAPEKDRKGVVRVSRPQ